MDTIMPLVEQRTHRRILMEVSAGAAMVWRRLEFMVRSPQFNCKTRNVSVSGAQIVTDRQIPPGTMLKLWVNSLSREPAETLELCGEVCWSSPHSSTGLFLTGVRFRDQPERNMAVWAERVRDLIRRHFRPVGAEQNPNLR